MQNEILTYITLAKNRSIPLVFESDERELE